jgi:L-demethylnoviosyl transferase
VSASGRTAWRTFAPVRAAVRALLADTAVTRRAGRVRDEIAAMPAPDAVATTLAGLTDRAGPGKVEACAGTSGF